MTLSSGPLHTLQPVSPGRPASFAAVRHLSGRVAARFALRGRGFSFVADAVGVLVLFGTLFGLLVIDWGFS